MYELYLRISFLKSQNKQVWVALITFLRELFLAFFVGPLLSEELQEFGEEATDTVIHFRSFGDDALWVGIQILESRRLHHLHQIFSPFLIGIDKEPVDFYQLVQG